MLTDIAIRKAKSGERLVKLSDGGGLQLWITPTKRDQDAGKPERAGSKHWYLAIDLADGRRSYPSVPTGRHRRV